MSIINPDEMNLLQQIQHFDPNGQNGINLFYDWFCKDSSLPNKGAALMKKVRQILPSNKFDNTKVYVFFKNNCPVDGRLYDDFRICDLETGDVLFTVIPLEGFTRTPKGMRSVVWGKDENGSFGELARGTWRDVLKFFNG